MIVRVTRAGAGAAAAAALLVLIAGPARSQQEPQAIPAETARRVGEAIQQGVAAGIPKPPVEVTANIEQAIGYRVGENSGFVLVPDKNLTAAALEGAGEKPVPVAIAAARGATLIDSKGLVGADRRAHIEVLGTTVPVFFLAVRKKGEERLLEVYSKDVTPLVSVPLSKAQGDGKGPIAVAFKLDSEKKQADVTLTLANAYRATLRAGPE